MSKKRFDFGANLYWGKIKPTKEELQTIKEINHKQAEYYFRDVVCELQDLEPQVQICIYKEGYVVMPLTIAIIEVEEERGGKCITRKFKGEKQ